MRQVEILAPDIYEIAYNNALKLRPKNSPSTLSVLLDWYNEHTDETELTDYRNLFIGIAFKHCFSALYESDIVVKSDRTGKKKYVDVQHRFNATVADLLGVKESNFANMLQNVRGYLDNNIYGLREKVDKLYGKFEKAVIRIGKFDTAA